MQSENVSSFSNLALHPALQEALVDIGFTQPTPIQQQTLPLTIKGYDVMGIAQTGTGKTATFLLSLMQYLMVNPVHPKAKGPYAIVLAPTRELAIQIKKDCDQLGQYTGLTSLAIYGGTSIEHQKTLFNAANIDIIIGTPGRIIDLYKQKVFRLKNIEICVLDEADRMFDLGFIDDVRYLLRQMPPADERLNLLFSATTTQKVQELAYEHFNAPKTVSIESTQPTADKIEQTLYHTARHEKTPLLLGLFEREQPQRSMIFLNTKKDLERLSLVLTANGYKNAALSGDITQKKREKIIKDFQNGNINILVATDIAARGIHVQDVTHVFNYDLPQVAEDYVHRIGRTARAGASGKAISFACEEYVYSLPEIEHYIGGKIQVIPLEDDLLADVIPLTEEDLKSLENDRRQRFENNNGNGNRREKNGNIKNTNNRRNNHRRRNNKPNNKK
ncbi:DEAD/DEAH box helicase [Suttonella ornithocola]|uniref:ATP-dependent RNA helicase RhlB n=1 Tax=Suttonella ornithocola TaxID=279832 RepID=A0A380MYG2_9GAMM|nr:DEAD/DEAH box helicase [Suttonella ornithocola]SUO97328.1 ATP-dependent RNA helicase rhlB [Suttonella ornithocola]